MAIFLPFSQVCNRSQKSVQLAKSKYFDGYHHLKIEFTNSRISKSFVFASFIQFRFSSCAMLIRILYNKLESDNSFTHLFAWQSIMSWCNWCTENHEKRKVFLLFHSSTRSSFKYSIFECLKCFIKFFF